VRTPQEQTRATAEVTADCEEMALSQDCLKCVLALQKGEELRDKCRAPCVPPGGLPPEEPEVSCRVAAEHIHGITGSDVPRDTFVAEFERYCFESKLSLACLECAVAAKDVQGLDACESLCEK
jgi:hypothetical protein